MISGIPGIDGDDREIAAVLPGIQFPELLPDEVGWVTSQLVFDVASATLGAVISRKHPCT